MAAPCIDAWMARRAAAVPGDLALVSPGERRTYGEFWARIRSTATRLYGLGVRAGDRVAFHGANEPSALDTLFAAASLGAAWVPIHPARPAEEVQFILEDAGVAVLVRGRTQAAPPCACAVLETARWRTELDVPTADPPSPSRSLDDLAVLAYTSGTTGPPRGVMLTHANLTWNALHMLAACAFSRADVTLAAAPLTRVGGLAVTVLEVLMVGGTVVIPDRVDGPTSLAAIEHERVTVLFANPDLLAAMAEAPGWPTADLSSIRTAVVGGSLVPEGLLRRYLERGVRLRHGYGLTEASPVVTLLDERDLQTRARSVGQTVGLVEARVVRPDGAWCAPGEAGELVIRGPNVTSGYWKRPDATAAAQMPDGWWRTGDAGSMDEHGYVTYLDRVGEAIELPEGRVYPAELERLLYKAPGIADAAALAVDGTLILAVVPAPGPSPDLEEIRRLLLLDLPAWKTPQLIHQVSEIPRNAAGKIVHGRLLAVLKGAADRRKRDA
jgi:fatty-acyl-CoA synthase